jgi:hypothetical protein
VTGVLKLKDPNGDVELLSKNERLAVPVERETVYSKLALQLIDVYDSASDCIGP